MWRIELLGGLRAVRGEQILRRFRSRKTGELLAYLAYYRERRHERQALADLLWPDEEPRAARQRLNIALSSLRLQLACGASSSPPLFIADRDTVQLNPATTTSDVADFKGTLQAARRCPADADRAVLLATALKLYAGDLLPDWTEEWALHERAHLTERYFEALGELIALLERAGDRERAVEWARRGVAVDPLREEVHRDLIRLMVASGQPGAALRQYEELRRLLARELGASPSAATRELLRVAHEDRFAARPAALSPAAGSMPPDAHIPPSSLLLPLTRFYGREKEIARLTELLAGGARLLTLTGPGGTGKSRLAQEVAGRLRERSGRAVLFVPLVDLADPAGIPERLLQALGVPRSERLTPLEQAVVVLGVVGAGSEPPLLLLDNFEHLLPEGAPLAQQLLERVAGLVALVTSRQALGIRGEQVFPVLPLPTPDAAERTERLPTFASVQLFEDRCRTARSDFHLTPRNAEAVGELCRRLEGLPLALELAAGRVGVLSPVQILARLSRRFDLLSWEGWEPDLRHRSLWAALEWSYRLLAPSLQRFFTGLSVFRGGWTLAAAAAVCVAEEDRSAPSRSLESLSALQACSMVIAEESGDEIRYRLLETLREFGAEQLSAAGQEQLSRRHAEYYLAFAEVAEPMLATAEQAEGLERLEREHDNFRRALDWAVAAGADDAGAARIGLRLGAALGRFWLLRGFALEAAERYARLLALPGCRERTAARAKAQISAAQLANSFGDNQTARPFAEESLAIMRELGDAPGIAHSCRVLGWILQAVDDYPGALALAEESVAIYRGLGSPCEIAEALRLLAEVCRDQGKESVVRIYLAESLALFRESGAGHGLVAGLSGVATQHYLEGDFPAARAFFEEALEIARRHGLRSTFPGLLQNLADVARCEGDYDRATLLCQEALPLWLQAGDRASYASTLLSLADAELQQGRIAEATSRCVEGLVLCREVGNVRYGVSAVAGLAGIAWHIGKLQEAARLLGAVEALCEAHAIYYWTADRLRNEREVAAVRAALPAAEVADLWAEGRSLSLGEAIVIALDAIR